MTNKLKLSSAKAIQKLTLTKEINGSDFKDKKLLEELCIEKIVHKKQLSAKKTKIVLLDIDNLNSYLNSKFHIKDLDSFIEVICKSDVSRSCLSEVTNDTKTKGTNVQRGIYVNTIKSLSLKIDNESYTINPMPNGSIFISYLSKVKLDKEVLLVIVENFENLLLIKKQEYLFKHVDKEILFVFRNSSLYKYLDEFENEVIYFGDIDLAGIAIYSNEIKPKVKAKSSFFIPKNLDELLANGNSKLYFSQYEKYKNLYSDEEEINGLIKLLHKYKKTIEQELFIGFS